MAIFQELQTDKVSNQKKESESKKDKPDDDKANNEKDNNKSKNKAISELETAIIKPRNEKSSSNNTSDTETDAGTDTAVIKKKKASSEEERGSAVLKTMVIPKPGKLSNKSNKHKREKEEEVTEEELKNDEIRDKYVQQIDELILQNSPDDVKFRRIRELENKNNTELLKVIKSLIEIKNTTEDEQSFFEKIADFFKNIFTP